MSHERFDFVTLHRAEIGPAVEQRLPRVAQTREGFAVLGHIVDAGRRLYIPADRLRISLLWKALAFKDAAARAEYADGASDLTLKRTLELMSEDLDARGLGKLDVEAGYEHPVALGT